MTYSGLFSRFLRVSSCRFVEEFFIHEFYSCHYGCHNAWRMNANSLAGSALRRADITEKPRIHGDRRPYTGARHRREHGDLFADRPDSPATTAGGSARRISDIAFARSE